MKNCRLQATKGKDGRNVQPSGSDSGAPKQNRLYALLIQHDHKDSPYVVNSILKVFYLDIYTLLDIGATL